MARGIKQQVGDMGLSVEKGHEGEYLPESDPRYQQAIRMASGRSGYIRKYPSDEELYEYRIAQAYKAREVLAEKLREKEIEEIKRDIKSPVLRRMLGVED